MTDEKQPQEVKIEFSVPTPAPKPTPAASEAPAEPASPKTEPTTEAKPALEIDLGATVEEQSLLAPTPEETVLMAKAIDDPSVLLAQELQKMPGIGSGRAAKMAINTDVALHNLNIEVRREMDMARRRMMQEMKAGKSKKRKRR